MSRRKAKKKDLGPTKEEIRKVYEACGEGDYPLVKKLLRPNIDLNAPHGKVAWTMMHFAAYFGHAKIVKLLLIKGARSDIKDLQGWGPVDYASREGHREVVNMLQDEESIAAALATIEARKKKHEESVTKAPEQKKKKKFFLVRPDSDDDEDPPDKYRQQVTRLLLNSGADPDVPDLCGRSPLDYANLLKPNPKKDPTEREEVLELMLNAQEALKRAQESTASAHRGVGGVASDRIWGGEGLSNTKARASTTAAFDSSGDGSSTSGAKQQDLKKGLGAGEKSHGEGGRGERKSDEALMGTQDDEEEEGGAAAALAAAAAAAVEAAAAEAAAARSELERRVYDAAGDGDVATLEDLLSDEKRKARANNELDIDERDQHQREGEEEGGQRLRKGESFVLMPSDDVPHDTNTTTASTSSAAAPGRVSIGLANCTPYEARRTPLHAAAHRHQPEAVELLLAWGARVDQKDFAERTPLAAAMRTAGF